ncbi:peptidoglycan-associated lipoprotein Pal [Rhodobacteraceae bacterium WD3A24]|nr:peptidoglycan-associated lipoprotein Pal [Rhodobacteraceae bacterium WD3A24]
MTHFTKLLIAVAALGLAACANPEQFGGGGADGAGATAGQGDAGDPTSPAYFNERVGDRVFFTVDSSSLSDEARATLRAQARWLNDNPDYRVIIEGHADERGTREYNVALGARRANAVAEFLNAQGIASGRIETVSYGKERPVEACAAQRCWDLNRRAVTVISVGAGV